jgi:cell division protein FtsI (penicillin-binding protein 3)
VGEALEPGSTFKLASMLALFEDGYISPNHMVDVELGRKMFFNQMMKDAEDHNFREITVKQLFAHSSNVGVSKLVYQYYSKNPDQYLAHLRRLQLDQLTGIEVPGEKKPRIKNTKDADWSKVSLPWMSVGYELNITPLRLLTLYNAVANDGKMMKPYLIESVREYNKIIKQHQPEVLVNQIAKPQTIQYLKEILEAVVIEGTAKNLYNNYYSIAGKTGTAQIATDNSGYGNKIYQSSFMGYFPADKPLYSIAVVVNNPKLAYYGSVVAAPVFKEIADNIYASQSDLMMHTSSASGAKLFNLYSGTQEDIIEVCNTLHVPIQNLSTGIWVSPVLNDSTITIRDINFSDDKIPSVVGMGLRDALYLLESKGIQVKFSGFGKVKAQSLPAGTAIRQDQTITLTLGL